MASSERGKGREKEAAAATQRPFVLVFYSFIVVADESFQYLEVAPVMDMRMKYLI